VEGHVEQPQLEIDEIRSPGKARIAATSAGPRRRRPGQRLEILLARLDSSPRCSGSREAPRTPQLPRGPKPREREHVQAQKAERREIALAQQTQFGYSCCPGCGASFRGRGPVPKEEKKRRAPSLGACVTERKTYHS